MIGYKQRAAQSSSAITQVLALLAISSLLCLLTAFAADPSWWSSNGTGTKSAVVSESVSTNNGVVTTNYAPNPYAAVNQGQLKQFTARAIDYLNENLPGGAGTGLTNLAYGWQQDYATNNYNSSTNSFAPYNPRDFIAMNVGQLKQIASLVYGRLAQAGYTELTPSWLHQDTADNSVANLAQLKQVFDFDLSLPGSSGLTATPGAAGTINLNWNLPTSNQATSWIVEEQQANGSWNILTTINNPNASSYSVSGLTIGQSYNFQVFAAGAHSVSLTQSVSATAVQAQSSGGWTDSDVGTPQVAGSSQVNSQTGAVTVQGAGYDIWATADSFHFTYQTITGDCTMIARVASLTGPDPYSKAGLMIRDGLDTGAINSIVLVTPSNGVNYQRRYTDGAYVSQTSYMSASAPVWLKIQRVGQQIIASMSPDGVTWSVVATDDVAMNANLEVGLAVASKVQSTLATAVFDNISVSATGPSSLPSTWSANDIGTPEFQGYSFYSSSNNGTFVVNGTGADVWSSSDQGQFLYQTLTGDGQIIAHVTAQQDTDPWAKAGVMFRSSLDPGSANAFCCLTPANGVAYQQRTNAGAQTTYNNVDGSSPGVWLKLERHGNEVFASESSDDVNWTIIGGGEFALGSQILAGLMVTPHNNSCLSQAVFDNVSVQTLGPLTPPAPWMDSDIGSPPFSGAAQDTNGTFTIEGCGADVWNQSDQLNFLYQPMTGDGTIIAKVNCLAPVNVWSKTGVMIRDSLDPAAMYAFAIVTPSQGVAFQYRLATGGSAAPNGDALQSSASSDWVKLQRTGNTFSAFYSTDGVNWQANGSPQTIPMGTTVYAGLPICSHDSTQVAEAILSEVSVVQTSPTPTPTPPGGPSTEITSAATAIAGINAPFNYAITASNTPTSFAASGLPSGLSVNVASGIIAGVPTSAGIFNVTLNASGDGTAQGTLVIDVVSNSAAPVINSAPTAVAISGSSFAFQITASNSPAQYAATGLPSGLSCDSLTGIISGTATNSGTNPVVYTVGLSVANSQGTNTSSLGLTVEPNQTAQPPVLTIPSTIPTAIIGQNYMLPISASVATTFSATGLPNGLSIDSTSGAIGGIPGAGTWGDYPVVINAAGVGSAEINLVVQANTGAITSPLSAYAAVGMPFNYTLASSLNPVTYTASLDQTESWLSFNAPAGVLSGTPTSTGTYSVTLGASNVSVSNATATLSIQVTNAPIITSAATASTNVDTPLYYQIQTLNPATTYSLTAAAGSSIPQGLAFNPVTGLLSGTPIVTGTFRLNLVATNSSGSANATLTVNIGFGAGSVAAITSPPTAYGIAGQPFSYTIVGNNLPNTFSAGNLPTWVTLNSATGVLSGTPPAVGVTTGTVSAISNTNGTVVSPLTLVIGSGTTTATATVHLQAGISPTSAYATSSATIAMDPNQSVLGDVISNGLRVGNPGGTEVERALIGFDLSVLPVSAVISSMSLSLTAEEAGTPATPITLDMSSLSVPFSPGVATWNINNAKGPVLDTISTATVTGPTIETWSTSSVSAANSALQNGQPLDLVIWSPSAEPGQGYPLQFFQFDDEGNATSSRRPELTVTYTMPYPPVIEPASINLPTGSSVTYQVTPLIGATSYSGSGLGLSINSSGLITGTPTGSGTFNITASNANGSSTQAIAISVGAPPVITSPLTATATVGTPFTYTATANNSPSSIQITGDVPDGLTLNGTGNAISGTATDYPYMYPLTITATNIYGTTTATLNLTVGPTSPTILGPLPGLFGNQGLGLSSTVPFTGDPTGFTLSSNLRNIGLGVDSYGDVSGTLSATASGTYNGTISCSNSLGTNSVPLSVTVSPLPVPAITPPTIFAVQNVPFYGSVRATVAEAANSTTYPTISFSPTGPNSLPDGLSMDNFGDISGTPTVAGSFMSTVSASDSSGTNSAPLVLTVYPPGPGIQGPLTDSATVGNYYSFQLETVSGGTSAVSTSATGPNGAALPAGLQFQDWGSYGIISGTPTTAGTYQIMLSATDSSGNTSTNTLVLTVSAANIENAQVGSTFSYTIADSNYPAIFESYALPANGLSLNSTTGAISGTPLSAGSITVPYTVSDAKGVTSGTLQILISAKTSDDQVAFQQGVSPSTAYSVPSASIAEDSSNPAVANQTFPAGSSLPVGKTTVTGTSRGLLSFNLSSLPSGATITSAYLVLHATPGTTNWETLEAHQIAGFDPISADWTSNSGDSQAVLASGTFAFGESAAVTLPGTPTFVQAVQELVQQPGTPNLNLELLAPNAEYQSISDYVNIVTNASNPANNPQLVVTYTVPNQPPVITSQSTYWGAINQQVNFQVTAANLPGNLTDPFGASGLPPGLTLNAATGLITGTVATVGSTAATINVTGSAAPQTLTFNIDNSPSANGLNSVSGNNQIGVPQTFLSAPLILQAKEGTSPATNCLVTFSTPLGGLSTTNTGTPSANSLSVVTDANGQAKAYLYLPPTVATIPVTVNSGTAAPVTMTEASSLQTSSSNLVLLSVVSGDNQAAPAGTALASPIVIRAIDSQGKPVSTSLTFVVQGGGSISGSSTVATDVNGEVSLQFSPGGSNGAVDKIMCSAPNADTIDATALVRSASSGSAPSAGNDTPPLTDPDPIAGSTTSSSNPFDPTVNWVDTDYGQTVEISGFSPQAPVYLDEFEPSYPHTILAVTNGDYSHQSYYNGVFEEASLIATSNSLYLGSIDGYGALAENLGGSVDADFTGSITFSGATESFDIVDENSGETVSNSFTWTDDASGNNCKDYLSITPSSSGQAGDTMVGIYQLRDSLDNYYKAGQVQFVVPASHSPHSNLNVGLDEASGSRYRKIALNGLPLADEKPQQTAESDQEKEESYVDALTDQLRHSTTDVYLPISGSDLSISARRDARSQVWSIRNGLRPHEQPDLPFGVGWSSNLAANIHFTTTNDPTAQTPPQAVVTDETGGIHTFFSYTQNGNTHFFAMPSAKNEQQVPNLETLTLNISTTPYTYTFHRKYGTSLVFQLVPSLVLVTSEDRLKGGNYQTSHHYARLIQATDRLGNGINYQFANSTSLIPSVISAANQPQTRMYIQQEVLGADTTSPQSVISAIWDANGNETTYQYKSFQEETSTTATTAYVLTGVIASDGHSTTSYTYLAQGEQDLMPHTPDDPGNFYWHADLASISDPLGKTYKFTPVIDHSKLNFMDNGQLYIGYYVQCGAPSIISKILLPDASGETDFDNAHSVVYAGTGTGSSPATAEGKRQLVVTDATGFMRTYRFSNAAVVPVPTFPFVAGSSSNVANTIAYQDMYIDYGSGDTYVGTEEFQFNLNAAMALSSVTDLSGNTTTYQQSDTWYAPPDYLAIRNLISNVSFNGNYDDPNEEIEPIGYKTFAYDRGTPSNPGTQIMTDMVDENGNHTHYVVDSLGRRTSEKISDSNTNEMEETDFSYSNSNFPGFITQKTVRRFGTADPNWVKGDIVTQYVPDGNGRIARQIFDPSGLALITSYTYDANGNKLSETNPRGYTTWFSYDSRNRLTTITYADGGQKQIIYDDRGNKTAEYDENGCATLYQYDMFNRLSVQARDMNGDGQIDSGDLITSYSYNEVNSKTKIISPNGGITKMSYDNLQRVTDTYTSPDNSVQYDTQFKYGVNSGGNAFDSSSFKPTQITDPRGYVTTIRYDALYRPINKTVRYDSSLPPASTSMGYDNVGNLTSVTDPVGNQTTTTYDGLNRPLVTTYADSFKLQNSYTSTGFKWQVIDPNHNITQSTFDNAGRVISVTSGYGSSSASTIVTSYDGNGNAVETVNPRLFATDCVFDARDRKVQEFEPAVLDADPASPTYNALVRPTLTWQYDSGGRLLAATDARNNQTNTSYDNANRVTDVYEPSVPVAGGSPAQPHIHTDYDADGNPIHVFDANNHETQNTYDLLDRLLTTEDAAGITVTNSYDQVGNKISVQDGNFHTTGFAYDGLNRNTGVTDAAGETTTLRYDGLNKTQRIDALGQTTTYLYDVRNRLQHVVYTSTATANSQRDYSYDPVGNLLSVTEDSKSFANTGYLYDALNRVTQETSQGVTHAYSYDAAGNRLQTLYGASGASLPTTTANAARIITSTYDALNRLSSMKEQTAAEFAANSPGRTSSYAYDLSGNIDLKTAPNGDTEIYTYDALNRSTLESGHSGGGSSLFSYAYGYDLAGNVLTVGETYPSGLGNRLVTNTCDAINRLMQEAVTDSSANATTVYTYDNANNRLTKTIAGTGALSTTYSYNNLNQLTGYSDNTGRAVTLGYDYDGNRIRRVVTGGSDNGTDTYSYDFENRLTGLVKNTSGGRGTYAYGYDYRTRRIIRDESQAGGVVTALVFSGGTSVQEYTGTVGGSPVVEYVRGSDYGGGVGGILYSLRGGTPSYTHENRRGDVVSKTDCTGSLTYQAQYEAFGKQTATTGSTLDRQKSNSKDTDPTGLVDEGFRYRDLETGMFITRDPAGFVDGPNLYTYVVQNPWTKFDPEGLEQLNVGAYTAAGAAGGAGVGVAVASPTGELAAVVTVPVGSLIGGVALGGYAAVHNVADSMTGHSGPTPTTAGGGFTPAPPIDENEGRSIAPPTPTTESIPQAPPAPTSLPGGDTKPVETPISTPPQSSSPEQTQQQTVLQSQNQADVHGNSAQSAKPQQVYVIRDKDGKIIKYGVTGQPNNQNGTNPRINQQTKDTSSTGEVTDTVPAGPGARQKALDIEQQKVNDYAKNNNNQGPPGNKKPQPNNQDSGGQ